MIGFRAVTSAGPASSGRVATWRLLWLGSLCACLTGCVNPYPEASSYMPDYLAWKEAHQKHVGALPRRPAIAYSCWQRDFAEVNAALQRTPELFSRFGQLAEPRDGRPGGYTAEEVGNGSPEPSFMSTDFKRLCRAAVDQGFDFVIDHDYSDRTYITVPHDGRGVRTIQGSASCRGGIFDARTGEVLATASVQRQFGSDAPVDQGDDVHAPRAQVIDAFVTDLAEKLKSVLAARGTE